MDVTPTPRQPRLILTTTGLDAIRTGLDARPAVQKISSVLFAAAEASLDEPVCRYEKEGRRLLYVSREVLRKVTNLSLAYRLRGEERLLRRAEAELLAAAALPDWNPSHFLDTAEMATALALGLDWLHDALSPQTRDVVAQAIIDKALRVGRSIIDDGSQFWPRTSNNWGQVCGAGLTLGSFAVWEREPELAEGLVRWAIEAVPAGPMREYAPDGAYPEGPGYWHYGTMYNLLLIDALTTATGQDFGLPRQPGFLESAAYIQAVTGPTLVAHNYQDARLSSPADALVWFAAQPDSAVSAAVVDRMREHYLKRTARRSRFLAVGLIWAAEFADMPGVADDPPLSWMARGETPVATHRSSWSDPDAVWLSIKGGRANVNHGHADVGSFVFEARGVRWASDLGSQDYHSLESRNIDLWDKAQDGVRWTVFRLGPWSHNILMLDGRPPQVAGRGEIVDHVGDGDAPFTRLDLSPVYAGQAKRVTRMAGLIDDRQAALIRDRIEGAAKAMPVRWAMLTEADVAIDGRSALLTRDGRQLRLEVLSPADARLEVTDVSEPANEWDHPNPGARQLLVHAEVAAGGSLELAVQLTPGG